MTKNEQSMLDICPMLDICIFNQNFKTGQISGLILVKCTYMYTWMHMHVPEKNQCMNLCTNMWCI